MANTAKTTTIDFEQRSEHLKALRNLKMARSAHSYVRGNTKRFYEWLDARQKNDLPEGPAVWICGDCHVGNLGPLANVSAQVQMQIRDVDQTVIGNPAHDLIRLGLSLAMAARGSDLPGVTTAVMVESLVDGYASAIEAEFLDAQAATVDEPEQPLSIKVAMQSAVSRSWKELASERLKDSARLPLGKRFWKLTKDEDKAIAQLFEKGAVSRLATMLSSRPDQVPVHVVDAAYWVKGCSSLGNLRYAVILGIGQAKAKDFELCLIDIKQAMPASAPSASSAKMPVDHARRVVEGARHLSPHLGERMMATELLGKPVFLRELMPQDLKLEIARLGPTEAIEVSRYLAGIVGKAHARQMDSQTARRWVAELRKSRSKTLDAPSWLWHSIVDLVANHEAGYLEHCRRYSLTQELEA
ncbi:DUF2252 family protein [Aquabacterium sp.]|uniref:DUF2252 family protein n=1 Tax=Aquabacterium sp. TaxID=1872578 RepID=UPI003D6CD9CA